MNVEGTSILDQTKIFLKRKFSEYYLHNELELPPEFEKREVAFVPLESLPVFMMYRHLSFAPQELKSYITDQVPANIYYSSAYYENPRAEKMEDKGWQGADLIFDIDADHLPIKDTSLQTSLKAAKKEITALADVVVSDLGLDKKHVKIVFSGGRGYHLHVYDPRFKKLDSSERREIIDYLMLNDINFDFRIPKSSQGERIRQCMKELSSYLLEEDRLEKLLKRYRLKDKKKEIITILSTGNFEKLAKSKEKRGLFQSLFDKCVSTVGLNFDAPVTADIKRLIRLPNSLHGKTGFRAMPVNYNNLNDFDPLRDSTPFGDHEVKVRVRKIRKDDLSWAYNELGGYPSPGDRIKVPEYVAVFMFCRGMALYGH
ncbi:MAG: DNA primase catalytic subunit PriS [Archaeoglobaceae archaeon]